MCLLMRQPILSPTYSSHCYRYFGTYLLQSSFVFLILARKLGKHADSYIKSNCTANL